MRKEDVHFIKQYVIIAPVQIPRSAQSASRGLTHLMIDSTIHNRRQVKRRCSSLADSLRILTATNVGWSVGGGGAKPLMWWRGHLQEHAC